MLYQKAPSERPLCSPTHGFDNGRSRAYDAPHGQRKIFAPGVVEVTEHPKLPHESEQLRAIARRRGNELQDIFTSRFTSNCDVLRGRLGELDATAGNLRMQIDALELELAQAAAMPIQEGGHSGHSFAIADGTPELSTAEARQSPSASTEGTRRRSKEGSTGAHHVEARKRSKEDGSGNLLHVRLGTTSDGGEDQPEDVEHDRVEQMYSQEVLSPLLQRKRAEARFREASQCHEKTVTHIKSELHVIERRIHKQMMWMKQVDGHVLSAEMAKARYKIRLENAQQRTRRLGQDLSKAYEQMARLLKDRLKVEGMAAHNDALTSYLDRMVSEDRHNAEEFIENRREMSTLLKVCNESQKTRKSLEHITEEAGQKDQFAQDIVDNMEQLFCLMDQLQKIWLAVPVSVKDSYFRRRESIAQAKVKTVKATSSENMAVEKSASYGNYVHPHVALREIKENGELIARQCERFSEMLTQAGFVDLGEFDDSFRADKEDGNLIIKALEEILDQPLNE